MLSFRSFRAAITSASVPGVRKRSSAPEPAPTSRISSSRARSENRRTLFSVKKCAAVRVARSTKGVSRTLAHIDTTSCSISTKAESKGAISGLAGPSAFTFW